MEVKGHMKCHGTATVGERGQVVLPVELRKKFKIVSGGKLIVLGVDHNGFERVLLMKSEAVTKMFGYLLDVKKVVGEDRIENIEKAIKKSGLKELEKPISKGKKKGLKFKVDV